MSQFEIDRIAVIGAGKMGSTLIHSLLERTESRTSAADRYPQARVEPLSRLGRIRRNSNHD